MKLKNSFVSAIAALLPVAASALTLNINGQNINVESVDINTTGSTVTITYTPVNGGGNGGGGGGGNGGGDGGDNGNGNGGGDGSSGGDGGTGNCGTLPANVVLADIPGSWASPGGQTRNALGAEIKAFRFKTTNNPAYEGQVSTVITSAAPSLRSVWISECPGGEPLVERCAAEGNESAVVRWAQNNKARSACHLQTNTEYYLNVRNSRLGSTVNTCQAGSCPFYMNIYHNQKP